MTFKTEKGQLAYQWLLGLRLCLWAWYIMFTLVLSFHPFMHPGGFLDFPWHGDALILAAILLPALVAGLAAIRLIARAVILKRSGKEQRTRSIVLLCLDALALLCSLGAGMAILLDHLSFLAIMLAILGVCILSSVTCSGRFSKEEKPVFTVKLSKKKLLVLSLAVLLLLPAFIPVESGRCGVYQYGITCNGMEYHALTYSIVTRTVGDEAVDFNIAIFPFNYQKKVYVHLDEFD